MSEYIHIYEYVHIYLHIWICVYMYICLNKFIYCVYICVCFCVSVHIHLPHMRETTADYFSVTSVSPSVLSAGVFYLGVPNLWHIRNLPYCLLSQNS